MTLLFVLVVDDDEFQLSRMERILGGAGIAVLQAASAEDARRLWRDAPIPIDMLITGIDIEGQSGFTLADELSAERPELPILFTSPGDDPRFDDYVHGRRAVLETPFTERELLAEVFGLAAPPIRLVARAAG
jgi:DNA-binding NtrC family response regulator